MGQLSVIPVACCFVGVAKTRSCSLVLTSRLMINLNKYVLLKHCYLDSFHIGWYQNNNKLKDEFKNLKQLLDII